MAGHNLFDIAFAWHLAGVRSVRDGVEFEMLLGMAAAQAQAVQRDVGGLLLYTPVVHPREFDTAIAYLVRRLEEGASSDNFMSALFRLSADESLYARERDRFLASLKELDRTIPLPSRRQDRLTEVVGVMNSFANTPDTDPSLAANASWGRAILGRVGGSDLGVDLVARSSVTSADVLETRIATGVAAGAAWGARSGAERASILRRAAVGLAAARGRLVEVMAAECGKTLDESDPEVSEAIDFANYYASLAASLDPVDGAAASPVALTVVTPPWNFPVAIPAGSVLAALAAGSAVIIKPAPQAVRCGAVLVDALLSAGVPADALQLVNVSEGELGQRLVADPRVGRLILTRADLVNAINAGTAGSAGSPVCLLHDRPRWCHRRVHRCHQQRCAHAGGTGPDHGHDRDRRDHLVHRNPAQRRRPAASPRPDPADEPSMTTDERPPAERLLAAAEELFGERSYGRTTVADICARAGMATGSFYAYFDSKAEIFAAVVRTINRDLRRAMAIAVERADDNQRARERACFRAFFDMVSRRPWIDRIVRESEFVAPGVFREYYEQLARGYARGVRVAQLAGEVDARYDPEVIAYAYTGIGNFVGMRWADWTAGGRVPDDVLDDVLELFARGLAPLAARSDHRPSPVHPRCVTSGLCGLS